MTENKAALSDVMEKFPLCRWWKAHEIERIWPETLLRMKEIYYVAACSRFITMNFIKDHAWVLSSGGVGASAMLLHSKGSLFPVFNGKTDITPPFFLERALKNIKLYSLQGLADEVDTLGNMLLPFGLSERETIRYKLMTLEAIPPSVKMPKAVSFRRAQKSDIDELLELQAAYEKEEVLPAGSVLDINVCRRNLERIIEKEKSLVAVKNDRIIGKINTNAKSYSRCQIGGVYVMPEYRGKGVASSLTFLFSRILLAENDGINLFVNINNAAARKVYVRCGFQNLSDYKIVYI
ncbi:MAG: GNAT family N-acetyltransferase [Spirochaetaceae bacterium]|jgi:ribosomal protein S18 acetylase RimI-like enzyme|nr:GNAT family N-acetyltransferase [Spirochaetaceae bacterium]